MPEATDFAGRSAPGDISFTYILLALASSPSLAYYIATFFATWTHQTTASSHLRGVTIHPYRNIDPDVAPATVDLSGQERFGPVVPILADPRRARPPTRPAAGVCRRKELVGVDERGQREGAGSAVELVRPVAGCEGHAGRDRCATITACWRALY